MKIEATAKVDMPAASAVIKSVGLDESGELQISFTRNVLRRIAKYMPYQSGALIKLMQAQTDVQKPTIVVSAPYAHYQFVGLLWVDPKYNIGAFYNPDFGFWSRPGVDKKITDTPLNYDTTKNKLAGPNWRERLVQNEGAAMVADLQREVDRRAK